MNSLTNSAVKMQTQARRPVWPGLHNIHPLSSSVPSLLFCQAAARKTTTLVHPSNATWSFKYTPPTSSAAAVIGRSSTFQRCSPPNIDSTPPVPDFDVTSGDDFDIQVTGDNSRRIRSRTVIKASLQTAWDILTDYEKLPDIIPSLLLSQLIEKRGNMARLFQIGEQKLAFGLNFSAKGFIDCYEKDFESLPHCLRREIEFKMVKGDFNFFEGKWSIEQYNLERCQGSGSDQLVSQKEFPTTTTLSYLVDVEPKPWLPVGLVQGRICRDIKMNLSSIKVEAEKRRY